MTLNPSIVTWTTSKHRLAKPTRIRWARVLLASFAGALAPLLAVPSRADWVTHGPPGPVSVLAVDPTSPSTVYAVSSASDPLSGKNSSGVFKTTNGGGSWSAVNNGLTDPCVGALVVDATTSPSTVYAGAFGEVFKTTDGGGSWSLVNTGLPNTDVFALVVDATTSPSTVYAGTGFGVFKTTDGGGSWSAANTGLPNIGKFGDQLKAVAVDATTSPSTLYAGTQFSGVF